jgi:hypothetical protein
VLRIIAFATVIGGAALLARPQPTLPGSAGAVAASTGSGQARRADEL